MMASLLFLFVLFININLLCDFQHKTRALLLFRAAVEQWRTFSEVGNVKIWSVSEGNVKRLACLWCFPVNVLFTSGPYVSPLSPLGVTSGILGVEPATTDNWLWNRAIREREVARARYIHTYTYIHTYIHTQRERGRGERKRARARARERERERERIKQQFCCRSKVCEWRH